MPMTRTRRLSALISRVYWLKERHLPPAIHNPMLRYTGRQCKWVNERERDEDKLEFIWTQRTPHEDPTNNLHFIIIICSSAAHSLSLSLSHCVWCLLVPLHFCWLFYLLLLICANIYTHTHTHWLTHICLINQCTSKSDGKPQTVQDTQRVCETLITTVNHSICSRFN